MHPLNQMAPAGLEEQLAAVYADSEKQWKDTTGGGQGRLTLNNARLRKCDLTVAKAKQSGARSVNTSSA